MTESQLQSLLNSGSGSGGGSTPPPSGGGGSGNGSTTPDTTPPTVTLNGDNPAAVAVGDTYTDAGATVTDDVDTGLTYTASVDGGASTMPDQIVIDTAAEGTHTIVYSATDAAGNTGTATRTVDVITPQ